MTALNQVLNQLAINVLPASQRNKLIKDLANQHGLNDALTTALLSGDSAQVATLHSITTTGCMVIVAPDVPAREAGCLVIVAPDVPVH